ncbi:ABC transporter permease, partial [Klebsiella pneumoniae]|nr:ABC transporter permease [Klebsiella pneumoniae]
MISRLKELVPAITLSSILLVMWEIGARIVDEMYILPSPSAIVIKIWKLKD